MAIFDPPPLRRHSLWTAPKYKNGYQCSWKCPTFILFFVVKKSKGIFYMICDLHFEFQPIHDHVIRDLTSFQTILAEKHMFRWNLENKLLIAYTYFLSEFWYWHLLHRLWRWKPFQSCLKFRHSKKATKFEKHTQFILTSLSNS